MLVERSGGAVRGIWVGYKIKNDMESTANSGQWGAGEIGKQKMHSTMLTKGREPGKQVSVSVERQKKKVNFMTCTHRVRGGKWNGKQIQMETI